MRLNFINVSCRTTLETSKLRMFGSLPYQPTVPSHQKMLPRAGGMRRKQGHVGCVHTLLVLLLVFALVDIRPTLALDWDELALAFAAVKPHDTPPVAGADAANGPDPRRREGWLHRLFHPSSCSSSVEATQPALPLRSTAKETHAEDLDASHSVHVKHRVGGRPRSGAQRRPKSNAPPATETFGLKHVLHYQQGSGELTAEHDPLLRWDADEHLTSYDTVAQVRIGGRRINPLLQRLKLSPPSVRAFQDAPAPKPVPDASDPDTVLAMAVISSNSYEDYHDGEPPNSWVDIPGYRVVSVLPCNAVFDMVVIVGQNETFGWDSDGLRGYVFANADSSILIVSFKGTHAKFLGIGGGPTANNDKRMDNLMFSCCCARVDMSWTPFCSCYEDCEDKPPTARAECLDRRNGHRVLLDQTAAVSGRLDSPLYATKNKVCHKTCVEKAIHQPDSYYTMAHVCLSSLCVESASADAL